MRAISPAAVECAVPPSSLRGGKGAGGVAGAAACGSFTCVDGALSVRAVDPFLPGEPWALAVVDGFGRFRGFVSRASLGGTGLPPRLVAAMRVGDLAYGRDLAFPESDSLRQAIETLASHHARALAVLDPDGAIKGLLTDVEALRVWADLRRRTELEIH